MYTKIRIPPFWRIGLQYIGRRTFVCQDSFLNFYLLLWNNKAFFLYKTWKHIYGSLVEKDEEMQ